MSILYTLTRNVKDTMLSVLLVMLSSSTEPPPAEELTEWEGCGAQWKVQSEWSEWSCERGCGRSVQTRRRSVACVGLGLQVIPRELCQSRESTPGKKTAASLKQVTIGITLM